MAFVPVPDNAAPDHGAADHSGKVGLVTALCGTLMAIEGLDNNVISYISPLIQKEFAVSVEMIGVIYSVTVFASLAGAVLLGPLSDQIGRRPLLITSSLTLALCSLATPLVQTTGGLIGLRILIGLAFGAAVPVAFSLVAEFAPARNRALCIMVTSSSVGLGYILAGYVSAILIPLWGWRVLLYAVGGASLIPFALLIAFLPESPAFVAKRAERGSAAGPAVPSETDTPRLGIRDLLRPPYPAMTCLLWLAVSSVYLVEFMFGYWMPTLLINLGYSVSAAGYITATGKIGGVVGTVAIGILMDRLGMLRVLGTTYAFGALVMLLLPFLLGSSLSATSGILMVCFAMSAAFAGAQALTVISYPPRMRATASGWTSGLGRFLGGGAGGLVGGALIGAGHGALAICVTMGFSMLVGLAAICVLGLRHRAERSALWLATVGK